MSRKPAREPRARRHRSRGDRPRRPHARPTRPHRRLRRTNDDELRATRRHRKSPVTGAFSACATAKAGRSTRTSAPLTATTSRRSSTSPSTNPRTWTRAAGFASSTSPATRFAPGAQPRAQRSTSLAWPRRSASSSLVGHSRFRLGKSQSPKPRHWTKTKRSSAAQRSLVRRCRTRDPPEHALQPAPGHHTRDRRAPLLHARGLRFRVDYPIATSERTIRVDIAFPRAKLAILIDGCFRHGCPEHGTMPKRNRDYWETKIARNRERDLHQTGLLDEARWQVIRFWTHQRPEEISGRIWTRVRT